MPAEPEIIRPTINAARRRIESHIRTTPTLKLNATTTLKLELLQHTGSFKPRGAFNRVLSERKIPEAGLVAASGGNHGAAVAYVARALGVPAEVYVPELTPEMKRSRIASYGAKVIVGGAAYDDAQAACNRRAEETGALLVHPFDHAAVVTGQGTVAAELDEQAPDLDTVLVACGGGGLVAGVAAWYAARRHVRVVAVEPRGMASLHAALEVGEPIEVSVSGLASDSLGARRIGAIALELCQRTGVRSLLIDEEAIVAAQRRLWQEFRLVAEPGGAAALAALWGGAYVPATDERVGVILCGSNCDPSTVITAADNTVPAETASPSGDSDFRQSATTANASG